MCLRQYLLILYLVLNTGALGPPCCGQDGYLIVLEELNETTIVCNSLDQNNGISLSCPADKLPIHLSMEEVKASYTKSNSLVLNFFGEDMTVENGSYCFSELLETENSTKVSYVVLCGTEETPNAFTKVIFICMLISSIFYFLTAIIYILLPQLRDVLGICIINFCVAIGIGLLIMALMNLVPYTEWDIEHGHCAARGFVAYFFLVAGFFWSNVISIQTLRSLNKFDTPDKDRKTISLYALYAWGIPVILTGIMAIVNYHPGNHAKPGIGLNTCWFISSTQRWYYLYSVMTVLILANIGIFIYVSIILWRTAQFKSDHARDIRYKFSLTGKLCILMGLPWIFEMIGSLSEDARIIWYILDIVNMLQGVLMFMVLVALRKRALRAMHARGWFLCLGDRVDRYLRDVTDAEADVVAQTDFHDLTYVDK